MQVRAEGIIVDERGRVYLIRPEDAAHWALPATAPVVGRALPEALATAVRQDAGLIVLALRLAGLYVVREGGGEQLIFVMRCLQRGLVGDWAGHTTVARNAFSIDLLPPALATTTRKRLYDAWRHGGGRPEVARLSAGRSLLDRWRGGGAAAPADGWSIIVSLAAHDRDRGVFWRRENGRWALPATGVTRAGPPWRVAVDLARRTLGEVTAEPLLRTVFQDDARRQITLGYTITLVGAASRSGGDGAFLLPEDVPAGGRADEAALVAQVAEPATAPVAFALAARAAQ